MGIFSGLFRSRDKPKDSTGRLPIYLLYGRFFLRKGRDRTDGHAKRGGGRVAARVHIAPAETAGCEQLVRDIERDLKKGG